MSESRPGVSVGEAALAFLATLIPEDRQSKQQEINKFVLWYGRERAIDSLTVVEIARYGEQLALSRAEVRLRLAPVKDFLIYAKKKGLIATSLASHVGAAGKTPSRTDPASKRQPKKQVIMTTEAINQMEGELATLKNERPRVANEIRTAAADKDFRENAPLEAAREHHEQLEARIKGLESTLNSAVVHKEDAAQVAIARLSCTVILQDLTSGEKMSYTLVSPNEVDVAKGKISTSSPVGKALLGRCTGEVIEVIIPLGKSRYRIEGIGPRN